MKVLVLDAMRPHLNPNPEIVHSIVQAFRRIGPPDDVTYATRWDFESLAASRRPELILAIASQIRGELAAPLAALRTRQKTVVGWWLTDDPYEIDGSLRRASLFDFVATNDLCCRRSVFGDVGPSRSLGSGPPQAFPRGPPRRPRLPVGHPVLRSRISQSGGLDQGGGAAPHALQDLDPRARLACAAFHFGPPHRQQRTDGSLQCVADRDRICPARSTFPISTTRRPPRPPPGRSKQPRRAGSNSFPPIGRSSTGILTSPPRWTCS